LRYIRANYSHLVVASFHWGARCAEILVPERMIDIGVCLRHIQYSVLTDHQASSRAATTPIVLRQRGVTSESLVILFSQISPSVYLVEVEAAVDFIAPTCVTVTFIFARLVLRAAVILTQGVRIGLTYAALGVTRVVSPAVAVCGLTRALRSPATCRAAALALTNAVSGLHHRQGLNAEI
jgi:hypothetical protein